MDTPSRRQALHNVEIDETTHPGLWLDKYLEKQVEGGGDNAKKPHFQAAAQYPVPAAYKTFFERWQKMLDAAGARSQVAKVQGRLAIGLGSESVLETAITLHRTYGVPYIPGSALKGLAAHYARTRLDEKWRESSAAYNILFGKTAEAGYVTFFDALYIPGSSQDNRPLALDVITVHHPEYYRGENSPPADWDSPIPVSFLSATGSYLIALHGAESWVKAAFKVLDLALKEEGIGAKTSSGYGRMVFEGVVSKSTPPPALQTIPATMPVASPIPSLPRKTARGKVKYDRGRPMIVTENGQRFFCNWRDLGMSDLKEKTLVEFEYEEPPDARPRVVKVRKI